MYSSRAGSGSTPTTTIPPASPPSAVRVRARPARRRRPRCGTTSRGCTRRRVPGRPLAGPVGQPDQKLGAQSAALPVVGDGDRDLGGLRVVSIPDITGDTHAAPLGGAERADRLVVVVVHVGQVAQLRR